MFFQVQFSISVGGDISYLLLPVTSPIVVAGYIGGCRRLQWCLLPVTFPKTQQCFHWNNLLLPATSDLVAGYIRSCYRLNRFEHVTGYMFFLNVVDFTKGFSTKKVHKLKFWDSRVAVWYMFSTILYFVSEPNEILVPKFLTRQATYSWIELDEECTGSDHGFLGASGLLCCSWRRYRSWTSQCWWLEFQDPFQNTLESVIQMCYRRHDFKCYR